MNKRKLWLAAAALCLCLCACGRQEEAPAVTQPITGNPPAQSGILTDLGQAETLQDYYGRTAIIARNERIEGSFTQTQSWALEYAMLEYPGCQAQISYVSGYQAPQAMFKDDLRAGVARWRINLIGTEVIMDGRILEENLKRMGLDEKWLKKQIKEQGFRNEKEILLGICDRNKQLTLYKAE